MILSSRPDEADDKVAEQAHRLSAIFSQFQLDMMSIRAHVVSISREESEVIVTSFASGAFAASTLVVKHWFEVVGDTVNCCCAFKGDTTAYVWPIVV